jgi:hypothetical protein
VKIKKEKRKNRVQETFLLENLIINVLNGKKKKTKNLTAESSIISKITDRYKKK